jgi:hypothetical protein
MNERKVRRSQTITPFGVGAIIDILGESFVAEDITRWRGKKVVLRGPRIAAHFGVNELRTAPPAEDQGSSLPYFRFPQWLFCGSCRRMIRWSTKMEQPGRAPRCESCTRNSQLVPMRFVSVCGNGHLDDVPWVRWAHSSPKQRDQRQCGREEISFIHVKNVGGGLESVEVRCGCGAARSLKDLPAPDALKHIGIKCRGRQPWQFDNESESCALTPVVLQRGASSVYFSRTGSALDIPPDSNWLEFGGPASKIRHNANFGPLESNPEHPFAAGLIDLIVLEERVSAAQVRQVLDERLGRKHVPTVVEGDATSDIQAGEWIALTSPLDQHDPRDNFISREAPFPSPTGHSELQSVADDFRRLIEQVVLVNRLREVRVLLGFQRHTMEREVKPSLGRSETFLPAIEVFGEGVFIRFNETALSAWETGHDVRRRAEVLRQRLSGSVTARWLDSEITPRLILLHTFAHVLMRAMAFEAGYSSSSLRERIYSATGPDTQAGVLIYTAAGDSEGTMGGLARLGEADRLVPILASTLATTQWCSLDPVCGESTAQGVDGLSLAACHACALVSETSCVLGNVMLDRMMLTEPGFGYFSTVIGALLDAQAEDAS